MTLLEIIKSDRQNAMIEKNPLKRMILSTLVGELDLMVKKPDMIGKELTDAIIIKKVKTLVDANIECNTTEENQYLECYLPDVLSETNLDYIIKDYMEKMEYSTMKDMGKVMGFLSKTYSGQYDGKIASNLVRKYIK